MKENTETAPAADEEGYRRFCAEDV